MKTSVVSVPAYVAAHGVPELRGTVRPEVRAIWTKIQKLAPISAKAGNGNGHSGEYILIEADADEDLKRLRNIVYCGLRGCLRRMEPKNFKLRMLLRRDEHHVVLWKESIDSPVERAQQCSDELRELAIDSSDVPRQQQVMEPRVGGPRLYKNLSPGAIAEHKVNRRGKPRKSSGLVADAPVAVEQPTEPEQREAARPKLAAPRDGREKMRHGSTSQPHLAHVAAPRAAAAH